MKTSFSLEHIDLSTTELMTRLATHSSIKQRAQEDVDHLRAQLKQREKDRNAARTCVAEIQELINSRRR